MMTLSQRGLQSRLNMDVSTIRRRGETVIGYSHEKEVFWKETWQRVNYADGRLMHYQQIKVEGK